MNALLNFQKMKKTLLFFLLVINISVNGLSQDTPGQNATFKPNNITISAGTTVIWHSATLFYERMLNQKMWGENIASFARIGGGYIIEWSFDPDYGSPSVIAQYGLLFGQKAHHYEVALGLSYDGFLSRPFSFSTGYRFQRPHKPLVIRAGLAYPEGAFLGFGFAF